MSAVRGEVTRPLRILHVHSGNMMGGVESMLLTMAESAASCPPLEQEFALVFDSRFADFLRAAGAKVHRLREAQLRNPLSVLRSRRELQALLVQRNYDAVVSHSTWCQVVFAPTVRRHEVPLIFWLHDRFNGHWLQYFAARNRPDHAICNSQFTQSSLGTVYPNLASEVVYCPVRPYVTTVDRERLRNELQADPDMVIILMASRTEAWKGHFNLLRAVAQVKSKNDWMVWIAGSPQTPAEKRYFESVQAEANRLQLARRIRFLGQRSDIPQLLRAADIYCQPNAEPEPFGVVFVEALQAGVPIVTFSMGGPQEILDERSGIMVPSSDIGALAAALERLIEDAPLRAQLGIAGPARARALCEPGQQLQRIFGIVSSVCDGRLKH